MAIGNENKRPEKMTLLDKKTVQEYFDELEKKTVDYINDFDRRMKESAKKYAREQNAALQQITDKLAEAERRNIERNSELYGKLRRQLIEENAKLERKRELDFKNEIYKKELELNTKSGKEKHKQELLNAKKLNEEQIELYKEMLKQGIKLDENQQQDLAQKQADVAEANSIELSNTIGKALNNFANAALNKIDAGINTYAGLQAGFNARIQGTSAVTLTERLKFGLNTFGALEERLSKAVGVQPYIKTETMLTNLSELVNQGIAANVEQRAFLNTIKDNIATTFDAANSSLLRIVRLQQSDSTAARLGMEAYLTRFLNNLVENTEYLNQTFDSVSDALIEASSQMSMKQSTEFEFVVQKWLGALTGTGLSEATAQSIGQALGYLGSGNISALNSSSMQNLLVMAASRAGLDYSSLLTQGLNASSTNQLMRSLAEYMVEIGGNSSNVVRSQMAQTFGLSISDLTAAKQLSSDFGKIYNSSLGLSQMYGELGAQLGYMPLRMSSSMMVQNMLDNAMFGAATNIAQSPALAALWKITDLIQQSTGGINLPAVFGMGTGVNMNATVEQLMKLGIVGVGSLGMIGDVISGIGSTLAPTSMLAKLGITASNSSIRRGSGLGTLTSGIANSISALIGNASGSDIKESVVAAETSDFETQTDEQTAKQYEDERNPSNQIKEFLKNDLNNEVSDIARMVQDIYGLLSTRG